MNEGSYVLTQAFSLLPRQIFQRLVKKYGGDYRVRNFNCTNQLRYMLYGQLTACESLRDICLCLSAFPESLYGLGITASVNESTLSRANESRDYRIYEGLGLAMIKIVQPLYSKMRIDYIVPQDHDLFALDSTTISCSINLMGWALGKYSKGAVKMHTIIDLRGSIPVFIHITDGRWHDSNVLDLIEVVPNAIYMMIRLTGYKSSKLYPKELRLVEFCDLEFGEQLSFITNVTDCLELNGLEIANLYRHRWDVESFFKLIKQNLTVKHLLGCSENAVKTHLWTAVVAYLLLARIKAVYDSPYTITEIGMLIKNYAMTKVELKRLVTEPQPLILNQDVNELTLF